MDTPDYGGLSDSLAGCGDRRVLPEQCGEKYHGTVLSGYGGLPSGGPVYGISRLVGAVGAALLLCRAGHYHYGGGEGPELRPGGIYSLSGGGHDPGQLPADFFADEEQPFCLAGGDQPGVCVDPGGGGADFPVPGAEAGGQQEFSFIDCRKDKRDERT